MLKLLLIALGGAVGTLARYGTSTALIPATDRTGFPLGTLAVNLFGCLVIGYLNGLFLERLVIRPEYRAMLLVGFLGGYTTFSTFGWETSQLLRERQYLLLATNVLISNVVGVALVIVGYDLGRR
jgi:CrcB protein